MNAPVTNDGAQRQPATITVVQTLLVLSAVASAVGLVVSVYLVSVVLDLVTRFQAAFSPFAGAAAQQPSPGLGSSPQFTVSAILALLEVVAVVVVSIWAFRAVAQARAVARVVLAVLAAAQVVLSVTSTLVAGAGVGLVVVTVLVGLLVFDVPVLVLLFVPAESRQWSDGTTANGHVAGDPTPHDPAPYSAGPYSAGPSAPPAPSWGPPGASGPPRSAPFPAVPGTGPFTRPPSRGPGPDAPRPPSGGRHSAPRPPQH